MVKVESLGIEPSFAVLVSRKSAAKMSPERNLTGNVAGVDLKSLCPTSQNPTNPYCELVIAQGRYRLRFSVYIGDSLTGV